MTDQAVSSAVSAGIPGRACGACMLCCKLPAIAGLQKPMGKWCDHARPGVGCSIYEDRPSECRAFHCAWLNDASLGPEWKPDRARFYIADQAGGGIQILVDPGAPGAWRDARFYPTIKLVASQLLDDGRFLSVLVGRRVIVVLRDRDVDLGVLPDGATVRLRTVEQAGRLQIEPYTETPASTSSPGDAT